MKDALEPLGNKIDMRDGKESDNQEYNKEADDKCSRILVIIQVSLIILFAVLSIYFFTFWGNAASSPAYYFYTELNSTNQWEPHNTTDEATWKTLDDPKTDVTKTFEILFLAGGLVYVVDALCRVGIVYGLFVKNIWWQIGGVVGTIVVSTFFTTALLVLIPVYRYNAAGSYFCDDNREP